MDLTKLNDFFKEILAALIRKNYKEVLALVAQISGNETGLVRYALSSMTDDRKNTLLHHMIQLNHYDQCLWLITNNASVLLRNSIELTAFDMAAGFIFRDKENGQGIELFFTICERACRETRLDDEVLKPYQVLHTLSKEAVDKLHQNLKQYQGMQQTRFESKIWWVKRTAFDLFGFDYTVPRAKEVAKCYFFLSQLKETQDYRDLVGQLKHMLEDNVKCSKGSMLHQLIQETLIKVSEVIEKEEDAFQKELDKYKIQHRIMQNGLIVERDEVTRAELKKRHDIIQNNDKKEIEYIKVIEKLTETNSRLESIIKDTDENTNRKLRDLEFRLLQMFGQQPTKVSTPPCEAPGYM